MIKKYKVTIEGSTPLVWDRMKRELAVECKKVKRQETDAWVEDSWWRKAEFTYGKTKNYEDNLEQEVFVPSEWILGMLRVCAQKTGINPNFARSKKQTYTDYIRSSAEIETPDAICKIKDLEKFGMYNVSKGQQIWGVYSRLKKWKLTFLFIDTAGLMHVDEIEELLTYGGFYVRIGHKRWFKNGRFDLKNIKEIK